MFRSTLILISSHRKELYSSVPFDLKIQKAWWCKIVGGEFQPHSIRWSGTSILKRLASTYRSEKLIDLLVSTVDESATFVRYYVQIGRLLWQLRTHLRPSTAMILKISSNRSYTSIIRRKFPNSCSLSQKRAQENVLFRISEILSGCSTIVSPAARQMTQMILYLRILVGCSFSVFR